MNHDKHKVSLELAKELKVERNGRSYNERPTVLINLLYDQLIARDPSIINQEWWAVFSLYLARSCGVTERRLKQELIEAVKKKINAISQHISEHHKPSTGNNDFIHGLNRAIEELDKMKETT